MYQISSALAYLHENNIMHMDIKPGNILIEKDNFQLCDFNIAAFGEGLVDAYTWHQRFSRTSTFL